MNKKFKYIEIGKGKLKVKETDNFTAVLNKAYGSDKDYYVSDIFYDESNKMRVFALMGSYYLAFDKTLICNVNGLMYDRFSKLVIIANVTKDNKYESLSEMDIWFIKDRFTRNFNGTFIYNTYIKTEEQKNKEVKR